MTKKILIPTDFSKNALKAITYASDLFRDKECIFYLLHAYKSTIHSRSDLRSSKPESLSFQNEKTKSEKGLARLLEKISARGENKNHVHELISVLDDPLSAMRAIIEQKDIDLVIMGTKGSSNMDHVLFGSNTINAMENLRDCPILGVPLDAVALDVKEIVFPTGFKTHYKSRELTHLVEIAKLHDANICMLYVNNQKELRLKQQEYKKLLEECLDGASFSYHKLDSAAVTAGVQRFVESRGSDMVAFINRRHSFFESLFRIPMVKELGRVSKVPLLVMHDSRG